MPARIMTASCVVKSRICLSFGRPALSSRNFSANDLAALSALIETTCRPRARSTAAAAVPVSATRLPELTCPAADLAV